MSNLKATGSVFERARRQENKAHNDLDHCERQAKRQKSQLDDLFKHKDECVSGLKTAKETGMTPVHIRELQLLMAHVNSVIETISFKVDATQAEYEKAKGNWEKKSDELKVIKEEIKKKEEEMSNEMTSEMETDDDNETSLYGGSTFAIVEKADNASN